MSARLIIAGAIVLAFALMGGAIFYYRAEAAVAATEAAQARANLAVAVDANKAMKAANDRLRATEAANDKIISEQADLIEAANDKLAEQSAELDALKETDPDVKSYLDRPVPDGLSKLLDH